MSSPDGVLHAHDPDLANMFSTDTPYTEIGPVRAALTSFALQTVGNHLARGAERAVQASSGLQVSLTNKNPAKKSGWLRIGENTIPFVSDVLDNHLKPAFIFWNKLRFENLVLEMELLWPPRYSPRIGRPLILAARITPTFCRLPVGYFILDALCPLTSWPYNSRIGTMPSYSTIRRHLEGLSSEEALVTSAHGNDPTKAGILLFDNVQNLARVRDHRIGCENHMNVGMSGLWRITYSERANLSVDRLVSFLDQEDADTTGYLAWLEVSEVKARYSRTAKLVIPAERSVVHVLAPSGKKETIPSELKDDTLGTYIGQEYKSHIPRAQRRQIGRSASSNMKKVEFYPGSQLLYLVLDARMLDCSSLLLGTDNIFEYFESLSKQDKLPDLEELVEMAKNCTAHTQLRGLAITRFMIPVHYCLGQNGTERVSMGPY
ncbi:hypothetical protein B0H13DRAFT_2328599 [Mycena leptocephala]|nr:hypothetical protein B0H13DRAFT_2328599 [Mycena leptocephala]